MLYFVCICNERPAFSLSRALPASLLFSSSPYQCGKEVKPYSDGALPLMFSVFCI